MSDTTRKIPDEAIEVLDELQLHLKRRGVDATQKRIIDASIKLAAKNEEQLVQIVKEKATDNTKEMMEKFLNGKKYDFGPNWLEEIDTIS